MVIGGILNSKVRYTEAEAQITLSKAVYHFWKPYYTAANQFRNQFCDTRQSIDSKEELWMMLLSHKSMKIDHVIVVGMSAHSSNIFDGAIFWTAPALFSTI